MNRRGFLALLIAPFAARFLPKKIMSLQDWPQPTPQILAYSWKEGGHTFYKFWPNPGPIQMRIIEPIQFHPDCFALVSQEMTLEDFRERYPS